VFCLDEGTEYESYLPHSIPPRPLRLSHPGELLVFSAPVPLAIHDGSRNFLSNHSLYVRSSADASIVSFALFLPCEIENNPSIAAMVTGKSRPPFCNRKPLGSPA
jgi:hypothetical protein